MRKRSKFQIREELPAVVRDKESNTDHFCFISSSTDINLPFFELF